MKSSISSLTTRIKLNCSLEKLGLPQYWNKNNLGFYKYVWVPTPNLSLYTVCFSHAMKTFGLRTEEGGPILIFII